MVVELGAHGVRLWLRPSEGLPSGLGIRFAVLAPRCSVTRVRIIMLVFALILGFAAGTEGPNRYGPPPGKRKLDPAVFD
jgi:hypothetical protein